MSDKAQDVVDAVLGEQGGQHEHEHQHQDPPASSLVVGHSSISGLSPQGMVFSTETEIRREEYAQVGGRKGTDGHTEESGQSRLKWIRKESFGSEGVGSRGKASRDRYGWGNMPLNAIHLVLSHTLDDIELDKVNESTWHRCPGPYETARLVKQRVWLCQLRLISHGWRNSIDSHSFWPAYTLALDYSQVHSSTLSDLNSSSLTPSTPSFPTLFHRSRHTTLSICLACRLNRPDRVGFHPANPRRITLTSKFGWTPSCDRHYMTYCQNCMREDPALGRDIHGRLVVDPTMDGTGLCQVSTWDIDEDGRKRIGTNVCMDCRSAAICASMTRLLIECARGGEPKCVDDVDMLYSLSVAGGDYVRLGRGTAHTAAIEVLEETWLDRFTRYDDLYETAQALQRHEQQTKMRYRQSRALETERERNYKLTLIMELRGEETLNAKTLLGNVQEMNENYRSWDREMEMGSGEDEDEEEEGDELLPKFWTKLRAGCIDDFINDRIRLGFWVSPADEVRSLALNANRPIHTPLQFLADGAVHPLLDKFDPTSLTPPQAFREGVGYMFMTEDRFLPPERLLRDMEEVFVEKLTNKMWKCLEESLNLVMISAPNDQEAEKMYEQVTSRDLLRAMKSRDIWVEGGLVESYVSGQEEMQERSGSRFGDVSGGQSTLETVSRDSPMIELVHDDETMDGPDYGIEEMYSPPSDQSNRSTSRDAGEYMGNTMLGKRKAENEAERDPNAFQSPSKKQSPTRIDPDGDSRSPTNMTDGSVVDSKSSSETSSAPMPITPDELDGSVWERESKVKGGHDDALALATGSPGGSVTRSTAGLRDGIGEGSVEVSAEVSVKAEDDAATTISSTPSSGHSPMSSPISLLPGSGDRDVGGGGKLHTPIGRIPWIPPLTDLGLGPTAESVIRDAWWEVGGKVRDCMCKICERGRRREVGGMLGWIVGR